MTSQTLRIAGYSITAMAIAWSAGCSSGPRHTVTPPAAPGEVTVCSKCYDEIVKAKGHGGPRGGPTAGLRTNLIVKHACEECKTEMSLYYDEQGELMVRCPKCAPEGVACDLCRPPEGVAK